MPTTVYGRPAIEIEQPSGDVVAYLFRALPEDEATAEEWRAWIVTSPKGEEHRVSEFPNGYACCSCPAWKWNRHKAGRWCDVNGVPCCKHIASIHTNVILPASEASK